MKKKLDYDDKIIIRELAYIPEKYVNKKELKENYRLRYYDEQACKNCSNKKERHNYICETCEFFLEENLFFKRKKVKSSNFYGIPIVDAHKAYRKGIVKRKLKEFDIIDKRARKKFKTNFRFVKKLREAQQEAINEWMKKRYGVLKAMPRTGKTLMGLKISEELGLKTIIISHQTELLDNFKRDFTDFFKTNSKNTIGYGKEEKDFFKYDIVLVNYKKLITKKGKILLKKIKNEFGTLIVDESHRTGAYAYSNCIKQFNSYYKIGLTATEKRRDLKHFGSEFLFGPVTAEAKSKSLIPKLLFVDTKIRTKPEYKNRNYLLNYLSKNEQRNDLILKYVDKDLMNKRKIIVTVPRVNQCKELADKINEISGENIARPFHGKIFNRKEFIQEFENNDFKVIIAYYSLIKEGVNLPSADTLYITLPLSSTELLTQLALRVSTKYSKKQNPLVRFFVDTTVLSLYSLRAAVPFFSTKYVVVPDKQINKMNEMIDRLKGLDTWAFFPKKSNNNFSIFDS